MVEVHKQTTQVLMMEDKVVLYKDRQRGTKTLQWALLTLKTGLETVFSPHLRRRLIKFRIWNKMGSDRELGRNKSRREGILNINRKSLEEEGLGILMMRMYLICLMEGARINRVKAHKCRIISICSDLTMMVEMAQMGLKNMKMNNPISIVLSLKKGMKKTQMKI